MNNFIVYCWADFYLFNDDSYIYESCSINRLMDNMSNTNNFMLRQL